MPVPPPHALIILAITSCIVLLLMPHRSTRDLSKSAPNVSQTRSSIPGTRALAPTVDGDDVVPIVNHYTASGRACTLFCSSPTRATKFAKMPGAPLLELRNIGCYKQKGQPIFADVNLKVNEGEVVVLQGKSGSGSVAV